jgi:hypothetical protein
MMWPKISDKLQIRLRALILYSLYNDADLKTTSPIKRIGRGMLQKQAKWSTLRGVFRGVWSSGVTDIARRMAVHLWDSSWSYFSLVIIGIEIS